MRYFGSRNARDTVLSDWKELLSRISSLALANPAFVFLAAFDWNFFYIHIHPLFIHFCAAILNFLDYIITRTYIKLKYIKTRMCEYLIFGGNTIVSFITSNDVRFVRMYEIRWYSENICIMQRGVCEVIIEIALIASKQFARLQRTGTLCIPSNCTYTRTAANHPMAHYMLTLST